MARSLSRSSGTERDMTRIAVVGGGIGGLTTAVALRRAGIDSIVYEGAEAFRAAGSGIWMPPNAMQIFTRLGIAAEVEAAGMPVRRAEVRRHDGQLLTAVNVRPLDKRYGCGTVAIHRSRLHEVLARHVGEGAIRMGRRCVRVDPEGGQRAVLQFDGGTRAVADVVIGADGLHSTVRRAVSPRAKVRQSGQVAVRGVTRRSLGLVLEGVSTEYWGPGIRFGLVRIAPHEIYWWCAFDAAEPGDTTGSTAATVEVDRAARGFPSTVARVVTGTPWEDRIVTPLADLEPLERWSWKRLVLLGDAAHAMTPNLGQGGAQAIEDAWVLAELLSAHEPSPEQGLRRYEAARRRKVDQVVRLSRWTGKMAHLRSPMGQRIRDLALRLTPGWVEGRQARWLYDVDGD
jgi:2-polyprenyl-6-methoxyphenol hydroxylase-like FAD-dependent oxidoreductase